jgi:hypothetical protein
MFHRAFGVLMALVAGSQVHAQTQSIGIVQLDGLLIPVAAFDAGQWATPWPAFVRKTEPSIDRLEALPPAWLPGGRALERSWQLEAFDGGSAALNVLAPVRSEQCGQTLRALATDIPKRPSACPHCCPVEKLGYAFDGPLAIQRFVTVDAPDAELRAPIEAEFDRLERAAVGAIAQDVAESWYRPRGYPLEREAREAKPVSLEVLMRSTTAAGKAVYYYRAARSYARADPSGRSCDFVSVLTGWILGGDSMAQPVASELQLTDCDRKGSQSLLPFATFALGPGRGDFALAQRFGWESEEVVVLEIGSSIEVVAAAWTHGL